MRRIALSTSSAAALCAAAFSSVSPAAADLVAQSRIDAVAVYPDAAIITRIAEVDLPQGDNVVSFRDLPLGLDPASLRVEAEGAGAMTIGAVDALIAPSETKAPRAAIEAKLAELRDQREGWQTTIEALQAKRAMIVRYSMATPDKLSPEARPLDIGQWNNAWDTVGAALAKLGDELRAAQIKSRELDEEIKSLEAQSQQPAEAQGARRIATVAINADSASKATVKLSYRIANVGWRAAYDASLATTSEPKALTLSRRALIAQNTGEDWSNVALTVSTSRVARAADVADVQPLHIDFWQPVAYDAAAPIGAESKVARARAAPMAASEPADAPAPAAPPVKAAEQVASLASGAYSAEFRTAGRISLASDGAQKSFLLGRLVTQPVLLVKAAPGFDQTAYLQAHIVDAEDAPLLAGDVALTRDGAFVGQSRIGFVAPGDGLDLGFGADDKIKVQRAPVNRKENEPTWYNQSKIETREFKTSVRNLHAFPVKVQVIDQLPISDNTAIAVDLAPATTPPTEKQVGDKRGVMSWTLDLAPGESKDIRFAYRLKWPADREVMIGGAPLIGPASQ